MPNRFFRGKKLYEQKLVSNGPIKISNYLSYTVNWILDKQYFTVIQSLNGLQLKCDILKSCFAMQLIFTFL